MHFLLSGPESIDEIRAKGHPNSRGPIVRPSLSTSRNNIDGRLVSIVDRAVAHERHERYVSMCEIVNDLESISGGMSQFANLHLPAVRRASEEFDSYMAEETALRVAREIGDVLCDAGIERQGGLCWVSSESDVRRRFASPDIYHGAAGIGIYLCELGRRTQDSRYFEAAIGAARWLSGPSWASGRAEPGLYCGESGIGLFFIRLAEATNDSAWLHAAELRARRLRGVPESSLDLVAGSAGLLTFLTRLARATHKDCYLDQALAASSSLIDVCSRMGEFPENRKQVRRNEFDCQEQPYIGLAHGLAGVALALTELAVAVDGRTIMAAVVTARDAILSDAVEGADGGWRWRESFDSPHMRVQAQCHGATGIGQFLLRLNHIAPDDRLIHAAQRAATATYQESARRTSPGICHGLAGDGGFLLECANALGESSFRHKAHACANRLQSLVRLSGKDGFMEWARDQRPDLLNGSAGVGWFHLQLSTPDDVTDPVIN